jgi:hypothetical protein
VLQAAEKAEDQVQNRADEVHAIHLSVDETVRTLACGSSMLPGRSRALPTGENAPVLQAAEKAEDQVENRADQIHEMYLSVVETL